MFVGRAVTLAVLHEAVRRGADLAYLNPSERDNVHDVANHAEEVLALL